MGVFCLNAAKKTGEVQEFAMAAYIFRRVLIALVTIFFVVCLTFILMNTVPGGPFLGEKAIAPRVLAELEAKYGLNKPLPVQLKNYILSLLQGDMGVSLKMQKNRPVRTIIAEMFPTSARIGAIALIWAVLVGVTLGCIAAYTRGRWQDNLLQVMWMATEKRRL